jgi:hypothetical protein
MRFITGAFIARYGQYNQQQPANRIGPFGPIE